MADYFIGTADPTITPDAGAGVWNSSRSSAEMWLKKQAVYQILPHARIVIGSDATRNMAHYLNNSGKDLSLNVESLIDDVPGEKRLYERELILARRFVQTLPVGTHNISSKSATVGYAEQKESWNWYFATGGYSIWGKGVAKVTAVAGVAQYELDFEYKFFDRYNWDGGKSVEIMGVEITDEFMGRFHREGYAKEYNLVGSMKRNLKWSASNFASVTITDSGGR
jgi:hypothetical protein